MEKLTHKYAGIPAYGWVAAIAVGAYLLMRMRSSSASSSADGTDTSGDAATTAGGQGQLAGEEQGYGLGYAAGAAQVQTKVPAGYQQCRPMKDPSGKTHTVCGQGHFVQIRGRGYEWAQGLKGTAKKKSAPLHRKPTGTIKRPPLGGKPVRQQPRTLESLL